MHVMFEYEIETMFRMVSAVPFLDVAVIKKTGLEDQQITHVTRSIPNSPGRTESCKRGHKDFTNKLMQSFKECVIPRHEKTYESRIQSDNFSNISRKKTKRSLNKIRILRSREMLTAEA